MLLNQKLLKGSLFILLFLSGIISFAQRTIKMENGGGPAGNGPSVNDQVVTMYNGDAGVYSPTTTVTYSISNQQYSSIEGASSTPGLVFGGMNSGNNTPRAWKLYGIMNDIGNAQNSYFSTGGISPGINVANDYAIEITTFTDALINANGSNKMATNSKDVYYGDLTITFSRPVTNPILHCIDLGAKSIGNLGLAAGLDLQNSNYTLTRLSGSQYFSLSGASIRNNAARITNASYFAWGSVQINGTNITSLTFKVVIGGDGVGSYWSNTSSVNVDAFYLGVSFAAYSVSGTVFNDTNGLSDNTVNGTGTNAGGLNAVLISSASNTVAAVAPVNSDGTYLFDNNVLAGDYSIEITKENATVDQPPPPVKLPVGWASTGENLGAGGGSDGTVDGILTGISVNDNVNEANFGINQRPVTNDYNQTIPIPTNNSIPEGTIDGSISGSDPDDGQLGNGSTVVITELPENGTLLYNGEPITAGQKIENFDPKLLSFTNLQNGTTSTSFKFSFVDNAGTRSATPATFTISWDGALPVTWGSVTARFSNGQLIVDWITETEQNIDHFEVEISNDGKHFYKVGSVQSKAENGNSSKELHYSFIKTHSGTISLAMMLTIVGIGFLGARNRSNKLLLFGLYLMVFNVLALSCNKKETAAQESDDKLFIRVIEVDRDGGKNISKTVIASMEQ